MAAHSPLLLLLSLAVYCAGAAAADGESPSSWWAEDAAVPTPGDDILLWVSRQCDPALTAFVWSRKPGEWARPERRAADGAGPLHLAARLCRETAVEALVFSGADLEQGAACNRTALHVAAAAAGKRSVMETLLRAGADLQAQDCEGNSPLHLAVNASSFEAVSFLLKHGADPAARNLQGKTALHLAAEHPGGAQHLPHLRSLTVSSPRNSSVVYMDSNATDFTMRMTHKISHEVHARRPVPIGRPVNSPIYRHPVSHFRMHGSPIVQILMLAGANVNTTDQSGATPLHCAASNGTLIDVLRILKAGADRAARDSAGRTPADRACAAGNFNAWKILAGAQPAESCWHHKAKMGPHARSHYKCKDDPNSEGPGGKRPLHYAAEYNSRCIPELLAAGADPNALDWTGSPALLLCAAHTQCDLAALLQAGADANATDWGGRTALHRASERGRAEAVKQLLEAGVEPDPADRYGDTPLHFAARAQAWQHPELPAVVAHLLEHGADREARNRLGHTPLQEASGDLIRKMLK